MDEIKRGAGLFYIGADAESAVAGITFSENCNTITIESTFVSEELRGQGIALKLMNKAVEYARAENKKIIPLCSYAKKVLSSNEYGDVLYKA